MAKVIYLLEKLEALPPDKSVYFKYGGDGDECHDCVDTAAR